MEHADALEHIEIAAVEPDGLERLMAGDTPEAAAVAGHLAGCPACVDELARIRRTAAIVREAVRSEPDPALRERTLAFVRAVGRERPGAVATEGGAGAGPLEAAVRRPFSSPVATSVSPRHVRLPWFAGLAAAVLVAAVVGFGAGTAWLGSGATADRQVAVLQDATETTMRIAAQPDARTAALTATEPGSGATGSLLFSATGGELVMTATGLAPLEAGAEYGCWVEVGGQRTRLGRMYWAGELWTWAGPASGLGDLPEGSQFGVSLVPIAGGAGEPVLTGDL